MKKIGKVAVVVVGVAVIAVQVRVRRAASVGSVMGRHTQVMRYRGIITDADFNWHDVEKRVVDVVDTDGDGKITQHVRRACCTGTT